MRKRRACVPDAAVVSSSDTGHKPQTDPPVCGSSHSKELDDVVNSSREAARSPGGSNAGPVVVMTAGITTSTTTTTTTKRARGASVSAVTLVDMRNPIEMLHAASPSPYEGSADSAASLDLSLSCDFLCLRNCPTAWLQIFIEQPMQQ